MMSRSQREATIQFRPLRGLKGSFERQGLKDAEATDPLGMMLFEDNVGRRQKVRLNGQRVSFVLEHYAALQLKCLLAHHVATCVEKSAQKFSVPTVVELSGKRLRSGDLCSRNRALAHLA